MDALNLAEKFASFEELWKPKIIGEVNEVYVKLVKVKGTLVWHSHDQEDELFLVSAGRAQRSRRTSVATWPGRR